MKIKGTHVCNPGLVMLPLPEKVVPLYGPALDKVGSIRLVLHPLPSLLLGDRRVVFLSCYVSKTNKYMAHKKKSSVCGCVFFPFILDIMDVPAGVTQEEGHTGFLIHLSAVHALVSREKDSAIPFPSRS